MLVIIFNQFSYDDYNTDKDRIFRINTIVSAKGAGQTIYATSPNTVHDLVDKSVVEKGLNLTPWSSRFSVNQNDRMLFTGYYADGDFFSFFQIPLLVGSHTTVLSQPSNIVLSKDASLRLFNSLDVLGETVDIESLGPFTVSGVFDMNLNKTHISSDFILPHSALLSAINQGTLDSNLISPNNYAAGYLYLLAKETATLDAVKGTARSLTQDANASVSGNEKGITLDFVAQPLRDITPGKDYWLDNSQALSYSTIILFAVIICILLALTCFNYSSIMTSLGLAKSKEIGVRKIVGASNKHVFFQFISESTLIALLSFIVGMALFPIVARFSVFQKFTGDLSLNAGIILLLTVFVMFAGFIAGFFPAITLSKLKEKDILQNVFQNKLLRGLSFRKIIIVLQFSIAMVMILFATTLVKQTKYMTNGDYGFDYSDIISVAIHNDKEYSVVRGEFQVCLKSQVSLRYLQIWDIWRPKNLNHGTMTRMKKQLYLHIMLMKMQLGILI